MAGPTPTVLTCSYSVTAAASYDTASITPTANKLILASCVTEFSTTCPTVPTLSGCGLTWVENDTICWDNGGTTRRTTMFRAMGSSPTTGALTFDLSSETQDTCSWSIVEWDTVVTTGSNGADAIVQSVQSPVSPGSETFLDLAFAAFADSNNATYAVAAKETPAEPLVGESGTTVLCDIFPSNNDHHHQSLWRADRPADGELNWTYTTARRRGVLGVEIATATAIGGKVRSSRPIIGSRSHQAIKRLSGRL